MEIYWKRVGFKIARYRFLKEEKYRVKVIRVHQFFL